MLESSRRPILYMIICATLWSIAGIFIKIIPWHPLAIAGWRSLISAGVVALYMKYAGLRFRLNRISLLAGVLLCLTFMAFVTANKLTTSANAIVLQFTAPVFIVLISSLVFRQRFARSDYLVVAITLGGIALCFLDQLEGGGLAGNCVGVFSGLVMAGMFIVTGRADDDTRMTGILLGQLFTAAVGVPVSLFTSTPLTTGIVASVVILGIFQLGIPYVLYGLAVGKCPPLVCSLIGAIEPLLNPVWVFLFDGESPGPLALAGSTVVIVTITAWCVWNDRRRVTTTS